MVHIALLRAINVGGHVVKMDRLRSLFAELGLANVRTYIQSGNVFFETDRTDRPALTSAIETHLRQSLGYAVPTCLRTVAELEQTLALDPFEALDITADMRCCVAFSPTPIPTDLTLPLDSPKGDMQIVQSTEYDAFVIWRLINGRPPTSPNFLEKTIGPGVTIRFFHTARKILDAAKARK